MKPIPLAAALVFVAVLAACAGGDKRLDQLAVGISKDSALNVMGVEKPARVDPFLIDGKFIEVMYYPPPGTTVSLPDRKMAPLVSVNGLLIGWGWKTLDSVAAETKIPVQVK